MILPSLISNLKDFKENSNGKISYRQFKKMVNSGEIAKWEAQLKEQIKQRANGLKGLEIAEYQEYAERQIVDEVYSNPPKENDLKLDADKVAEEVRKMINENNKYSER